MPSPKRPCPQCSGTMSPNASACRKCKPTYERTDAHRNAMSAALIGRPRPNTIGRSRPEHSSFMRAWWTPERKESARQRGLIDAENRDWLLAIATALSGEKNPNYQGKGRQSPYAPGWGRGYRSRIRARAAGICERCGRTPNYPLDLHHRDFAKTNHAPDNLLVLCRSCHKFLHFASSANT